METPNPNSLLKLRSACDHCHISKVMVRCSGEKSGCRRCEHGGRICHYSASNMGKIIGDRRRKRKNLRLQLDGYTALTPGSEGLGQALPDLESLTSSLTQDLNFWPQFNTSNDLGFTDLTSNLEDVELVGDVSLTRTTDTFSGNGFFEIDFLTPPQTQPDYSSQLYSQSQSPASPSDKPSPTPTNIPSNATDQQSTDLAPHIRELSQKLSQSPLALDEVLSVNATYLQIIDSNIAKLPTNASRMSNILMNIICLTQVLSLFEECMNTNTSKSNGPALFLGSFEVDPESQKQIRLQIVRKELMRVFNAARELMRALEQHNEAARSQNQTYLTLVTDVQKRVRFLAHIVRYN